MIPYVDPDMAPLLAEMRSAPPVDYRGMTPPESRALFERNAKANNEDPPPLASVMEATFAGPGGARAARIYRPPAARADRAVIFAHGGGWTLGSIDSHDRVARLLAIESGVTVISIDYRLAPEHPAPAGARDTLAAIDAAASGAFGAPMSPASLVLSGDSAGANVALAALTLHRDRGGLTPAGAMLFYGAFAPIFDTWSQQRYGGTEWGLSSDRMRYAWEAQLGGQPPTDPVAAPLHADLTGMPPLHQIAAGLDPLCDDSVLLARRAAECGVPTTLDIVPGVVHGFLRFSRRLPAARNALARAGATIWSLLD